MDLFSKLGPVVLAHPWFRVEGSGFICAASLAWCSPFCWWLVRLSLSHFGLLRAQFVASFLLSPAYTHTSAYIHMIYTHMHTCICLGLKFRGLRLRGSCCRVLRDLMLQITNLLFCR